MRLLHPESAPGQRLPRLRGGVSALVFHHPDSTYFGVGDTGIKLYRPTLR